MPAMSKETAAAAVSLSQSNFAELKIKELATAATAAAAMSNTATAGAANGEASQRSLVSPPNQQPSHNICGCDAASPAKLEAGITKNSTKYISNGHSSHLSAAVDSDVVSSLQHHGASSCRNRMHSGNNMASAKPTTEAAVSVPPQDINSETSLKTCSKEQVPALPALTPSKKSSQDFIFGKYIGEGSFSIVYLAVDVTTKKEYAIKVCEKRHILREHKQEYIRREREVMHMMTNVPGFVNLSCTFQDNRSLYFVMTYAKNGDLLPYINKVGSFDVDCTRHYAAELVLACEQMHRLNIVHRDLKPENILLDENMHTLIADFGSVKVLLPAEMEAAANSNSCMDANKRDTKHEDYDVDEADDKDNGDGDDGNDTSSDGADSSNRKNRYSRKRRGSFVGTAQYVSPEVLQNGPITPAADLWALGCIVYQMISGLPPFRGSNDYVIFKDVLACNLDFPQGFHKDAEDLVRKLLKINPEERLGAQDIYNGGYYESIRKHAFFESINFDTVRQKTPPPIYPYLPGVCKDEDFRSQYRVPDDLKPGLDDKQLTRLLGMELGTSLGNWEEQSSVTIAEETVIRNIFDLTEAEKQKRLEQQKSDKWHVFADNEVMLRKGYVNKRKGLFARKRMLLLTTGPRLIYIDPVQMVKKGEIPWSAELRVEPKNFKIFFVHTPNRTYYLEDPEGYSLEWVEAIENMRMLTYKENRPEQSSTLAAGKDTTAKNASK